MARRWTEEEMDRAAADLVDETIIAAGGDLKRAERVLRRVLPKHGKKRPRRHMLWV
jgi:hypothetical protein